MPSVVPHKDNDVLLTKPYNVVLLNDDDHSYEYVCQMLGQLFGYGLVQALKLAQEVDLTGKAIVWTGPLEYAEFKRDQIHAFGKDPRIERCKGSMSAVVEPA